MTQAEIFHDFMRAVSEGGIKDEKGAPLYDKYHNAREVAETMGAKQVARVDDRDQWLFPDGSTAEAINNGSGRGR
jgi:hypothetical protein